MSEGIVKAVEQMKTINQSKKEPTVEQESIVKSNDTFDKISLEVYRYFNLNPVDGVDSHLKAVNNWASTSSKGIGDMLRKIRNLEIKLGQPKLGESRLSKLSNWIRLSNTTRQMKAKMGEELKRTKDRFNSVITGIRSTKTEKLGKINDEIMKIQKEYRNSYTLMSNRTKNQIDTIRDEYENQIKELKVMRNAYKGD